jgi:mannosyl-oligosaccharide alpha-1,2-mannosidase
MAELSFFEHLSCFAGAMFSTSGVVLDRSEDFIVGVNFTDTCADSYRKSKYGLGGEKSFVISNNIYVPSPSYHHRPEVIESVFYMWRYSGDEKYRIFGEEMIKSLEQYCRNDIGYHSLNSNGSPFNRQETFLIAETFKYLYLLFSDDNTIPRKKMLI